VRNSKESRLANAEDKKADWNEQKTKKSATQYQKGSKKMAVDPNSFYKKNLQRRVLNLLRRKVSYKKAISNLQLETKKSTHCRFLIMSCLEKWNR